MLDLFTIFTKGGIVLWYFRGTNQIFAPSVNALIRSVILQVMSIWVVIEKGTFKVLHFFYIAGAIWSVRSRWIIASVQTGQ